MKRSKLPHAFYTLLYIQNHGFVLKNTEPFIPRVWCQKGSFKSDTTKKDMLSYITSRNMRKTLRSNLINESDVTTQQKDKNVLLPKEILSLLSLNWLQFKTLFSLPASWGVLKFNVKSALLRHLAKKQPQGKRQTKEQLEESWGGPEAYKLITFLGNDFNSVIEKNPSVLVFFSAYWCIHCLRLRKPYGTAAVMAKNANLHVMFATFDVTVNPDIADEKGIIGIPMIKYYQDGRYLSTFKGKRNAEELLQFAMNPLLQKDEIKNPEI